MTDSIVQEVIAEHQRRAAMGERKYGVTLDRDDLDSPAWLMHLRDELMDGALYATKLMHELAGNDAKARNVRSEVLHETLIAVGTRAYTHRYENRLAHTEDFAKGVQFSLDVIRSMIREATR